MLLRSRNFKWIYYKYKEFNTLTKNKLISCYKYHSATVDILYIFGECKIKSLQYLGMVPIYCKLEIILNTS